MTHVLNSICDIPGVKVGLAQNNDALTGCTVILPDNGAVAGVDIRGSAPGTREIEAMKPARLVPRVDAILLAGGSAFGLDAAGGVQQYLEEQGRGFDVGVTTVPIVPSAVIFDLHQGDPKIRPDKQMGYKAALSACSKPPPNGLFGAGLGATVGKVLGPENAMRGGQGSACSKYGDIYIGALAVVNAFGNIVNPEDNSIIAGARNPETGSFVDAEEAIWSTGSPVYNLKTNTTLAVVVTDAALTKETATQVATMAHAGFVRTIRPCHTPLDGDLIFALSVGEKQANALNIGSAAAQVVSEAIVRAVSAANGIDFRKKEPRR